MISSILYEAKRIFLVITTCKDKDYFENEKNIKDRGEE